MTKKTAETEGAKGGIEMTSNDAVQAKTAAVVETVITETDGFVLTTFVGVQAR